MTGETETRLTETVSAQVTEEIEITVTEGLDGPVDEAGLAAPKIQHAVPDRGRARDLFERLATLSEDDEERLRIRGELVELHLPLVEYLARRFRNRGEWLDDLTQVATIGLIKSIDRFDLARGVEFSTYATPTIVGEIKRHFRDKGWAVRVPRRLQELKLALTKAIGDLAQREGRAPTVAEIAAGKDFLRDEPMRQYEDRKAEEAKAKAEEAKKKAEQEKAKPEGDAKLTVGADGMMSGVVPGAPRPADADKMLPVTTFGRYVKVLLSSNEFIFLN